MYRVLLVGLALLALFARPVDAGEVDGFWWQLPLDVSEGVFAGVSTDFYFNLPSEWFDEDGEALVMVMRITYTEGPEILDWFNIDFVGNHGLWPVMQLYVFDRNLWTPDFFPLTVVMQTPRYVFAVNMGEASDWMAPEELEAFEPVLAAVSRISDIAERIDLGPDQFADQEFAVIVDGNVLEAPVELVNDRFYIPLREVCVALGHDIYWCDYERKIIISKDDEMIDSFFINPGDETALSPRYHVRIINDRVHVVAAYFVSVFRTHVQIDAANNVIITSQIVR